MAKKQKKKKSRIIRIRRLNNQFISVVLGAKHKSRGQDLAGFRVVRGISARYDRKLKQVVEITARLFGGDRDRNGGWNGPKVKLQSREFFTGKEGLGVEEGRYIISVDVFVRRPKEMRGVPPMLRKGNAPVKASDRRSHLTDTLTKPPVASKSVSGAPETPRTPKVSPGRSQQPPARYKSPRAPRPKPLSTLAPPFQDEPTVEREAPETDELTTEGPDLTPDVEVEEFSEGPDAAAESTEPDKEPAMVDPKDCVHPWHTMRNTPACPCPVCNMDPSALLLKSKKKGFKSTPDAQTFEEDKAPAANRMVPADIVHSIPPLREWSWASEATPKLVKELAALLARKPSLLQSNLPDEPHWFIVCPQKDKLLFCGYGKPGGGPVLTEIMILTGYEDPQDKSGTQRTYSSSNLPAAKVNAAIKALLDREAEASKPDVEPEPSKKTPSKTKAPENPDDYFS